MKNRLMNKNKEWLSLLVALGVIILINIIGGYYFHRFDLTSERRYSLSKETKEMISEIDDLVFFKIYLDGEFPAGFKRLRQEIKEMLDEFRAYNKRIQYQFVNPSKLAQGEELYNLYNELSRKGLNPTELHISNEEGASSKIIFPGAIVSYKGKEVAVNFLASQREQSPEQALNQSIQNIEYNLANAVVKATNLTKKKVAFVTSNSGLSKSRIQDISKALSEHYIVSNTRIDADINALTTRNDIDSIGLIVHPKYDLIIVAKPDSIFSDKDKFILDQYLMYGGKILWLTNGVQISMDSLRDKATTVGLTKDVGLQDLFFNYGFRVNSNLVMDLQCAPIPIVAGNVGGQPQYKYFPWYYFPLASPASNHPIVADLNSIKTEFVSSIDTIPVPHIKKTPLLKTSPYSRLENTPVVVSLSVLNSKPNPAEYKDPKQIVALLLEGEFKSFYKNRIPPEIENDRLIAFKTESEATKMIIISDGGVIANQLHYGKNYPLPLGFDQFTGQTYGNKDLILNSVNYLLNDISIIGSRSKDIKLRLLDQSKVEHHRNIIQWINTLGPILIIIIMGIVITFLRKRRYR